MSPSAWFANVCLSLAGLVYSFGFETWLVVEHEKVYGDWSLQLSFIIREQSSDFVMMFCVLYLCSKVSGTTR